MHNAPDVRRLTRAKEPGRLPEGEDGGDPYLDPDGLPPIPTCFGETSSSWSRRAVDGYGFGHPKMTAAARVSGELPMPGPRQLAVANRLMYGQSSLSAPSGMGGGGFVPAIRREPPSLVKRRGNHVVAGQEYRRRVMERRAMPTMKMNTVTFGCGL